MANLFDLAAGKVPPKAKPIIETPPPIPNAGAVIPGTDFRIGQRVRTGKVYMLNGRAPLAGLPNYPDGPIAEWLKQNGRPGSERGDAWISGENDLTRRKTDPTGSELPANWLGDIVCCHSGVVTLRVALDNPDGTVTMAYVPSIASYVAVRGRPYVKGLDPVRDGFDSKGKGEGKGEKESGANPAEIRAIVTEHFTQLSHELAHRMDDTFAGHARTLDKVLATINDEINKARPVTIKVGKAPAVEIDMAHSALERTLSLVAARFNVLLVGPAGCGKTTLGAQVAKALGRDFGSLSCSLGMPESAIVGKMIPNIAGGTDRYVQSTFVRIYREGGVFLADEMDAADASTLLLFNSAIANGFINLPNGELAERHDDFAFIAACNTYGNGADRMYVGRSQLDTATLDRFVGATLSLDYDRALEKQLCRDDLILKRVWHIRDKARELKLRRCVSTRMIMACNTLVHGLGDSLDVALLAVTEGWTPEDRKACGVTK